MSNTRGISIKIGSSSGSQQSKGKGNINKRKSSDPSPLNPINSTKVPQHEPSSDKASSSQNKPELQEPPSSQWNDPLVHQLQSILVYKIHTIFNTAVQQLVDCGYNEDDAQKAITRIGFYREGDIVQNIVNDALVVLKTGKIVDCIEDFEFDNLLEMVEYTMVELVLVLIQVKPSLTIAEGMWWLLVFDMDIVQACGVKGDLLAELKGSGFTVKDFSDPSSDAHSSSPSLVSLSDKVNHLKNLTTREGGEGKSSSDQQPKSPATILEETLASKGRKPLNRKELETLQKVFGDSICLSKDKANNVGDHHSSVEKRIKSQSKSLGVQKKGSKSKSKGKMEAPTTCNHVPGKASEVAVSKNKAKGTASTSATTGSTSKSPNISDYCGGMPFDASLGRYIPRDSKDEMILNLVSRVEGLQKEMQSWSDWANQKVMEATTRLSKDKNELKALRQEREEVEKLKREKKMFEENAMKRLSELQCAMVNASCQVEVTNDTLTKLKEEQAKLWTGMEVAKLQAVESSVNCEEALEKEQKTLKEVQSWNGQLSLFQEELKTQKQKTIELQLELSKAEKVHNQIQAKLKEETTQKEELLKKVASLKNEQEQLEAALIEEEEMMKQKAKTDMKKYEEVIKILDGELSQLKLKCEGSRIADLKRGMGGNYGAKDKLQSPEPSLKRERECVMCLSEERSVVFLPCAHEVLCGGCNEIHEKQGMKDCPSCRTLIVQRIVVRFSH